MPIDRRTIIGGGAAALGVAAAVRSWASDPAPAGAWTPLADMPFRVQEIYPAAFWRAPADLNKSAAAQRGVLVNAGGLTPSLRFPFNVADATTIYDPSTNEWSIGVKLPEPRHHIALIFHSGALYALSGFRRNFGGGWQMQSTLWRIDDPASGEWAALAPLPAPQAETVAVSIEGRIVVAGGRTPAGDRNKEWEDHADTGRCWAYDASADAWEERAPLPTARNSAAGAVLGDVLYVVSGRTVAGGNTPACEAYDPQEDRWRAIAPLPEPIRQKAPRGQGGLAAAVWNGKIYAFGGEWFADGGGGVYADAWEYDPREDKWRAVAAMTRPRHGLGAVALEDGVYVAGGALGPSAARTSAYLDRFAI